MTDDGRLDLDELGEVIGGADSLAPDDVVGEEPRPTVGERLESAGITPFVRRHRVPVAAVAAAALLLGGTAWVRRDTRPPDDGQLHATVVDGSDGSGNYGLMTSYGYDGTAATAYTLVQQRAGDDVRILGLSGPGVGASSATESKAAEEPGRRTFVVAAVPGCLDPASLTPDMSRYRLLVRRTDAEGRVVDGTLPLPLASLARWDQTLGSACLRRAAARGLVARWGAVTADPAELALRIPFTLTNGTGADLLLWSRGWAGMTTRQDDLVESLPAGTTTSLVATERVGTCEAPALPDVPSDPTARSQLYESDRGIGGVLTVATGADGAAGADWAFTWDDAMRARVQAGLRAVCAGAPAYQASLVRSSPAPAAVQRLARSSLNGDPQAVAVRTWVDVATTADSVTARDVQTEADIEGGSSRQFLTRVAVVSGGRARVAVDWLTTCGATPGPPTYQLLLHRGGRTWPMLVNLDYRDVAFALRTVCPVLDLLSLQNAGWAHVVPGT